jgi:O-antigen/teichoic acid export membrane protein
MLRTIIKNSGVLSLGVVASKILGIAAMPIITRVYSPADLGIFSLFSALSSILIPIVGLKLAYAIPLARQQRVFRSLVILATLVALIISITILLPIFFFENQILSFLDNPSSEYFLVLVVVSALLLCINEILSLALVRAKAFKSIAITQVLEGLIDSSSKIALSFFGISYYGLVVGYILQSVITLYYQARLVYQLSWKANFRRCSLSSLRVTFLRFSDFPKYKVPGDLLFVFSAKIPLLYFAFAFDVNSTGQLGLALMVMAAPITLIGQTISKAYYAEISTVGGSDRRMIFIVTSAIVRRALPIGVALSLIAFFQGEFLFRLFFGDEWLVAGEMAGYLAIGMMTQLIANPIIGSLAAVGRQRVGLIIHVARLVLVFIVFQISYLAELSSVDTIAVYSIVLFFHYLTTTFIVLRVLRHA